MQFENLIIKYRIPIALLNVKNNEATMRSQITWKHCELEVVICDTAWQRMSHIIIRFIALYTQAKKPWVKEVIPSFELL